MKIKSKATNTVTEQQPALDTGVRFKYTGSKTTANKALSYIMGTLMNYILTIIIGLGAMLSFTTMFSVEYHNALFLVLLLLFGLGVNIALQIKKKIVKYVLWGVLGLIVALPFIFFNLTLSGFEYVRDFVLVGIAENMRWSVPELSYTFSEAMKLDTTFLLTIVGLLVVYGVTYFTVKRINFFFIFLITFPLFEIGALFGMVPNHFWFAAMLSGWMGVFAMHSSTFIRKIKKKRSDKKKTKTTAAERKQTLVSSIGMIVAIITFLTFALGNFIVEKAGYSRPEDMKQLRSDFKTYVSDLIDYILGTDNDGSMREGKLYQLDDREIKNRHYLTLQSHFADQSYLRGYIAGEYTGSSWEAAEIEPNYAWLNEVFESSGLYPQNMQGKALVEIAERNPFVKNSISNITISNLRRKKDYAYTAYVPLINNDFNLSGEYMIEPKNKSEYTYSAFTNVGSLFTVNTSDIYNEKTYSSIWKEYTKYVKYTYTKAPSGLNEVQTIVDGLVQGTGYGFNGEGMALSNIEIADRIREYLKANVKYSLVTPAVPEGEDFVSWLLLENKKGYAPHYATAMAIMLRMADVPTRYVEGYVITQEEFKNSTKNEDGSMTTELTDANAHAWIEIYESNYGWFPIEATPGFYEGRLIDELDISNENLDAPEQPEELLPEDSEDSDMIFIEEEVPELELIEDEETPATPLQIIINIIKYFFIFVGLTVASFIVLLLLTFIILVIRRLIRLKLLKMSISSSNYNRKVTAIYKYYIRLLRFDNIVNTEHLPYLEFAQRVAAESTVIEGEKHIILMNKFLKYRFSDQVLTDDELLYLEEVVTEFRQNKKKLISGEDKFEFMFIENLG
ncbi:MAG: transglutaminase domain-containing protein [Clostridia bacterium]|nr:transglutaminase domain-containing protein [Clostridia bacterium]